MKANPNPTVDYLPDSLPGLLLLQQRLSSELSLKSVSGLFCDAEMRTLQLQNECLKKQLLALLSMTDRLALIWRSDNFSAQPGLG